jgi:hypothetical protein
LELRLQGSVLLCLSSEQSQDLLLLNSLLLGLLN